MYNYSEVKNKIEKFVKEACFAPENKFKSTVWEFHVLPVVEHAMDLGKKLGADLEVLELAALLHDYAGILDFDLYPEHHIHGSQKAREILLDLLPQEKIDHIADCILSHRGSIQNGHKTIESKILASADAMSHITELADMMFLTYGVHKYETKEGAIWLRAKLERSWEKIMPEGRDIVKDEYMIAIKILNKAIKK